MDSRQEHFMEGEEAKQGVVIALGLCPLDQMVGKGLLQ